MRLIACSSLLLLSTSAWAGLGSTITFFGASTQGTDVRLNNGDLWLAGTGNQELALGRYLSTGIPDSSFGLNGQVETNFSSNQDIGNSIAFGGGKSLVAGSTGFTVPLTNCTQAIIARYNTDGSLDTSFSSNGKLTTSFGLNGCFQGINDIRVDGNQRIWVVGFSSSRLLQRRQRSARAAWSKCSRAAPTSRSGPRAFTMERSSSAESSAPRGRASRSRASI